MRVLIAAYACEPNSGSEPTVGWNWALQATDAGHDVHVVTRTNNRDAIEEGLLELRRGPTFHYVDLPRPLPSLKKKLGWPGLMTYYYLWQVALARTARRLHRELGFDLLHHVTFVNDSLPSGLAAVSGPRFIWGPVGGSTHRLPSFAWRRLPMRARIHERFRATVQSILKAGDPFLALTRRRADRVLVYTDEALAGLPVDTRRRARSVVHIGVDATRLGHQNAQRLATGRLRVVTGGRLVHWKGLDLLVEAFAALRHAGAEGELIITGDGPERPHLEALALQLGIGGDVTFVGHLPSHDELLGLVATGHVYALPTLRDGPPVALLEAMSLGVPVLCLDAGATCELVPEGAGIRIPADHRAQIVADITASLLEVDHHRELLVGYARTAADHVERHHTWHAVGRSIRAAYAEVGECA